MIVEEVKLDKISTAFPSEVAVNFGSLGPGLVALVGDNGQGKSHIEESIIAACYGRWPSYGELFHTHLYPEADNGAVEVSFRLNGDSYRVRRRHDALFGGKRGKTEAWLWRNGGEKPIAGERVSEVDLELEKILPPLDVLLASNFACQSHEGSFFELSKADRKRLFIILLGLEKLQVYAQYFAAQAKEAERQLDDLRKSLESARAAQERAQALLVAINERRANVERLVLRTTEVRAGRDAAIEATTQASVALADAQGRARAAEERCQELNVRVLHAQARIEDLATKLSGFRAVLQDEAAVRAAAIELEAVTGELTETSRQETELARDVRPMENQKAQVDASLATLRAEYARLKEEKKAAEAAADRVEAGKDLEQKHQAYRQEREGLSRQVAEMEEKTPALRATADAEREQITARNTLLARRKDAETAATLEGVDLDNSMCRECPLTANAVSAGKRLEEIDHQLVALQVVEGTPAAQLLVNHELSLQALRRTLTDLDVSQPNLQQLATLEADRQTAAKLATILEQMHENIRQGKKKKEELDRLTVLLDQKSVLVTELAADRAKLEERRDRAAPLARRLEEVSTARANYATTEEALAAVQDQHAKAHEALAAIETVDVEPFRLAVEAAKATQARLSAELTAAEAEKQPIE